MEIKHIGTNLRILRKDLGLTKSQMAEITGISLWEYTNIEKQTTSPSLRNLIKICKSLNITIEYLLTDPIINLYNTPYTLNKERLDQLTCTQLKYISAEDSKVMYELAVIFSYGVDNNEEIKIL